MPYHPDYSKPLDLGTFGDVKPDSFLSHMSSLGDMIRRVRETVHEHTPGPLMASSMVMGAPGLAAGGAIRAMPTLARTASSLMSNAGASPMSMAVPGAAQAPSELAPEWRGFKAQADKQAALQPAVPNPQLPWWATGDMTKMFPGAAPAAPQAPQAAPVPAPTAPEAAPVPMPQARPAEAPQAQPDTSFFMRNALSMRDPSTGELIDPSGASSVRGPDLISKMMTYLHNK
jgi:hypothetical protein